MKKQINLLGPIQAIIEHKRFTPEQITIINMARAEKEKCGLVLINEVPNSFSVPLFFPDGIDSFLKETGTRDIGTQEYILPGREQHYLIDPVSLQSVFIREAGATFMQVGMNEVKFPTLDGILAQWVDDETEPASDGDEITISGASLTNKRMFITLDVPRSLILQGGPEADRWIRSKISEKAASLIDETIGGVSAGSTNKPQGMGYAGKYGVLTAAAAVLPTHDNLLALENSVTDYRIPLSKYAYVTNLAGRRILSKVRDAEGVNPVLKDGKLNGFPIYFCNQISSAAGSDGAGQLLAFGPWSELVICQFGAYDIVVDPYTLKKVGKVQLTVNAYFDIASARGSVATSEDDSTEANRFAGFAAMAIK